MPLTLRIGKDASLGALEDKILQIAHHGRGPSTVWLAADTQKYFFEETRIASLLATAARAGPLTIVDWSGGEDSDRAKSRFRTTPDGLAAVVYSGDLRTVKSGNVDFEGRDLVATVIDQGGLAEARPSEIGKNAPTSSLTICAFDDQQPEPLVFAGIYDLARFISKIQTLRRSHFEVGIGAGYAGRIGGEADRQLAIFIYELYQNTYFHGRRDSRHAIIKPGMRYIRLKRHIGVRQSQFTEKASGFTELQEYMEKTVPPKGQFAFWEVTVSDHGIGIVDRFLATRPEYRSEASTYEGRVTLANRIINEALSSNLSLSGAGYGIRNALAASDKLRGFTSVRSGDLWLYHSSVTTKDTPWLNPVSVSGQLGRSAGTQFSMLFPLSEQYT